MILRVLLLLYWWQLLLSLSLTNALLPLPSPFMRQHHPAHHHGASPPCSSHQRSSSCLFQASPTKTDPGTPTTTYLPTILYESNRLLIIDKPAGIAHHNDAPSSSLKELGIITLLRQYYSSTTTKATTRLWGVHRLDRVTSGMLVLAKDRDMAKALTNAFATSSIDKIYVGVSAKKAKKKQGWVQGVMRRSRNKSWKLVPPTKATTPSTTTHPRHTNFAKTRFVTTPLSLSMQSDDPRPQKKGNCILFRPYTGKTHQLRVAAKAMGIPLLGDPIYKGKSGRGSRTHLHASGLSIPSLEGEPTVAVWSPPPFFLSHTDQESRSSFERGVEKLMTKHQGDVVPSPIYQAYQKANEQPGLPRSTVFITPSDD